MKKLLEKIEELSRRDKKTLSQKALKAGEELGELSRAILPLETAHGTLHRTPDRDKVVEECVDLTLVAYSIAHSMGVSFDDFLKVMERKTQYWEFLTDNEDRIDPNGMDFEIHITVRADAEQVDQFSIDCASIGVKPIVLDLITNTDMIIDMMTSSTIKGSTHEAVRYCKDVADRLRKLDYDVVREKIETVPWHPAAQTIQRGDDRGDDRYFEAHIAFQNRHTELASFATQHGIHLSKNRMKRGTDVVLMGTYRKAARDISSVDFTQHIESICRDAETQGFEITRPHVEFSLHDDNQKHDKEWLR